MKIEVVIKPSIMKNASIIWEPSLNSFADWWCSMYVGREMYKQKSFRIAGNQSAAAQPGSSNHKNLNIRR